MLRFLTAGESHGPGLVAVVEGLPAGLEVTAESLAAELARRRRGPRTGPAHGGGGRRPRDPRAGCASGAPWAGRWRCWCATASGPAGRRPWPRLRAAREWRALAVPRPGHADLAGMIEVRHPRRPGRAGAGIGPGDGGPHRRRGAGAGAAGHGGGVSGRATSSPSGRWRRRGPAPEAGDRARVDRSPVRCLDPEAGAAMVAEIDRARREGDTLGGVVEVLAYGVPAGVGSHVHWDRRLDAALAGALMSIPGIKGVEVGDGFAAAARHGTEAHDAIGYSAGAFARETARAGGIEGGMSTGQAIRLRAAMKPLSSLRHPAGSVDVVTKRAGRRRCAQRSDTCAVPGRRGGGRADGGLGARRRDGADVRRGHGGRLRRGGGGVSPPPRRVLSGHALARGDDGVGQEHGGPPAWRRAWAGTSWTSTSAVAATAGRPIPAIFAAEGEAGFRRRETAALVAIGGPARQWWPAVGASWWAPATWPSCGGAAWWPGWRRRRQCWRSGSGRGAGAPAAGRGGRCGRRRPAGFPASGVRRAPPTAGCETAGRTPEEVAEEVVQRWSDFE